MEETTAEMASDVLTVSFFSEGDQWNISDLHPPASLEMPVQFTPHRRGNIVHCMSKFSTMSATDSWLNEGEGRLDGNLSMGPIRAQCQYSHFSGESCRCLCEIRVC